MQAKIIDPQIGMRLTKTRQLKEMSQRELARRSEVSFAYISRIESGDRHPSFQVLRRIASALEVSPHYLETGDVHGVWVYVTRDELIESSGGGCHLCERLLHENPFVAA